MIPTWKLLGFGYVARQLVLTTPARVPHALLSGEVFPQMVASGYDRLWTPWLWALSMQTICNSPYPRNPIGRADCTTFLMNLACSLTTWQPGSDGLRQPLARTGRYASYDRMRTTSWWLPRCLKQQPRQLGRLVPAHWDRCESHWSQPNNNKCGSSTTSTHRACMPRYPSHIPGSTVAIALRLYSTTDAHLVQCLNNVDDLSLSCNKITMHRVTSPWVPSNVPI